MKSFSSWQVVLSVVAMSFVTGAHAQIVSATPVIPDTRVMSPGGVDMRTGEYVDESRDLSIGSRGGGGFTFFMVPRRVNAFSSNWHYYITKKSGASGGWYYQIENAAIAKTFFAYASGGPYVEASISRDPLATLQWLGTGSNRYFLYTAPDGTTTRFLASPNDFGTSAEEIRHPDGITYTFSYDTNNTRLRRVSSNTGYQLILEYFAAPNSGTTSKVCVINAAFTTPPASHVCPAGARSVSYTYSGGRVASVTDAAGATWTMTNNYAGSGTPFQESFYKPGIAQSWLTNSYVLDPSFGSTLFVGQQSFAGGRAISYDMDNVGIGEFGSGTVFLGLSWTENSKSTTSINWKTLQLDSHYPPAVAGPESITDPLGRQWKRTYDAQFTKVLSVAQPSGRKATYGYNANRSVIQVQSTPSTGFSDPALSVKYTYDCTAALNCKKPATMTDARGNTTHYTHDPIHGGLLTETLPAPAAGEVRPQKRYAWAQYYAWYRNTGGVVVQAPTPVWRLSSVSECRTLSSCAGGADEIKTTFTYGVSGAANNLLVTEASVAAGDASIGATRAYTYDANGDRLTNNGPLPGSADSTVWKYDSMRRVIGEIGPDPDGAGALRNRATRNTFDAAGRLIRVERGTTLGQSDVDFAAFVALESTETDFDALDRPTKVTRKSGVIAYGVAQFSYDTFGRLECAAIRMNPAVFGSLLGSACSPGAEGAQGPDRITRRYYDAAGQLTRTQVAVGTPDVADDQANSFTVNGKLAAMNDAENNRTTFEYDGYDRLRKVFYPVSAQGQQTSSSTDFEQLAYDENDNVKQRRLRNGQVIGYSYDNLNRVTLKDLPPSEVDVAYTDYDLQGHLKSTSQGNTWTTTWDALGRKRSETSVLGTMSYDYDAASRRTKTTWPDGFYVTQDFFLTDEVKAIREYGATSGIGVLATYDFDDRGNRTRISRGNGTTTYLSPDPISRLASLSHDLAGTTRDVSSSFSYTPAGQIGATARDNDAYAWMGHYNVDRLDAINGLNEVTTSGATSIGYDALGNVATFAGNYFYYTAENRLTSVFGVATLVYDAYGRLFASSIAGTHSRFQYDGENLAAEYDSSNVLQRRYVHGPGVDEPLVWYEGGGGTDRRWYHQDERGSVVGLSNNSGNSIATNTYDEYGVPGATNVGRFQYTGQTWLPALGLYYYKARVYSPYLGRFLQTDPIGYADGTNLYAYVGNDPTNQYDPSGLWVRGVSAELQLQPYDFAGSFDHARTPGTTPPAKAASGKLLTAEQSQCVDDCNADHAWIGNCAGGAAGGAVYGALMGSRGGPAGLASGLLAGLLGGGFAGAATSYGSPGLNALAAGAGSMMRAAGTWAAGVADGLSAFVGGVSGSAIRLFTGGTAGVSATAGAMLGTLASGSSTLRAVAGAGSAGAAAGVAGLATKSYVDGVVNNYCVGQCTK